MRSIIMIPMVVVTIDDSSLRYYSCCLLLITYGICGGGERWTKVFFYKNMYVCTKTSCNFVLSYDLLWNYFVFQKRQTVVERNCPQSSITCLPIILCMLRYLPYHTYFTIHSVWYGMHAFLCWCLMLLLCGRRSSRWRWGRRPWRFHSFFVCKAYLCTSLTTSHSLAHDQQIWCDVKRGGAREAF